MAYLAISRSRKDIKYKVPSSRRGNTWVLCSEDNHGLSSVKSVVIEIPNLHLGLGSTYNHLCRLVTRLLLQSRSPASVRVRRLPRRRQAKGRMCRCETQEDISRCGMYHIRSFIPLSFITNYRTRRDTCSQSPCRGIRSQTCRRQLHKLELTSTSSRN